MQSALLLPHISFTKLYQFQQEMVRNKILSEREWGSERERERLFVLGYFLVVLLCLHTAYNGSLPTCLLHDHSTVQCLTLLPLQCLRKWLVNGSALSISALIFRQHKIKVHWYSVCDKHCNHQQPLQKGETIWEGFVSFGALRWQGNNDNADLVLLQVWASWALWHSIWKVQR